MNRVFGALIPDMTMCNLPLTWFFHYVEQECYLKDPSRLKRTKSWSRLPSLLAWPDNINMQKGILSPKDYSLGSPLRSLLKHRVTFPATDQALVRAATGVPGRQDRSYARRPKVCIYSGSAIWAGFPSLAQVTSKRGWIMSISSQGHKSFSIHLALDVFPHLDRNCRTHRSSHLYITILIPLGTH